MEGGVVEVEVRFPSKSHTPFTENLYVYVKCWDGRGRSKISSALVELDNSKIDFSRKMLTNNMKTNKTDLNSIILLGQIFVSERYLLLKTIGAH